MAGRRLWFCLLLLGHWVNQCGSMRVRRPWSTEDWCDLVTSPKWPFAYSKCETCEIERKGRVNSNLQDMRHRCSARGVRSKCHGRHYNGAGRCSLEIQGVDWVELPINVPTVSDVPWAVGGRHRFDYEAAEAICVLLSGGQCLAPTASDYSQCVTRCWGYQSGKISYWQSSSPSATNTESSDFWEFNRSRASYQGQTTTIAGSGVPGHRDGVAKDAQFSHPQDVAVDEERSVYVADTGNHCIRKVGGSNSLVVSTVAGTRVPGSVDGPVLASSFSSPSSIAYWIELQGGVPHRILYIADTGNHRIRKLDLTAGSVSCYAGRCGPSTDSETLSENLATPQPGFADGPGAIAKFSSPLGVAVDGGGIVFVADTGNHLIRMILPNGTVITLAGNVRPADELSGCPPPCLRGVRGFRDGSLTHAQFSFPSSVTVGQNSSLLVTDNHRVRRVLYRDIKAILGGVEHQNRVTTIAGQASNGETDGTGEEAQFHRPMGIEMSGTGRLFVSDAGSCRLRQISPVNLVARNVTCQTRLVEILRPSGCSAYVPQMDKMGAVLTPQASNIYYNFRTRNQSDVLRGLDRDGRTVWDCTGAAPPSRLLKGPLAVDMVDSNGEPIEFIDEDTGYGTRLYLNCPADCGSSSAPLKGDSKYTEGSSLCKAAIHAGIMGSEGGLMAVVLERGLTDLSTSSAMGSVRNGITSQAITDLLEATRLFSVEDLHLSAATVQTIGGKPAAKLERSCGFLDTIPAQESAFNRPHGLSLYLQSDKPDTETVYVADTYNHRIRAVSPVCSKPCENGGSCIAVETCQCQPGWTGDDCTTPVCSSPCPARSVCVGPNRCGCIPGYGGAACDTPLCVQDCMHGSCTAPDTCTCSPGWFDSNCTTPVCSFTCGHGGRCMGPDMCQCPDLWTGSDCRIPVCKQSCKNGGYCTAPNTCSCPIGWSGHDCGTPICTQGTFIPDPSVHKFASNRPRKWDAYVPCQFDEWCESTGEFDCKQRMGMVKLVPWSDYAEEEGEFIWSDPGKECLLMEIRVGALSPFPYIDAEGRATDYARYSRNLLFNFSINSPWRPILAPTPNHTGPFTYDIDRQIALVQKMRVTQGVYVCANGGNCTAPDVCECPPGWVGFDCRTPVCEQGYYVPSQSRFTDGSHPSQPTTNPTFSYQREYLTSRSVDRERYDFGGGRYLGPNGTPQGGYSCSERALTRWEKPNTIGPYGSPAFLFEHPNYYSRYMDKERQPDDRFYTHWIGKNWPPTYRKTLPLLDRTNEGWRRGGVWQRTSNSWQKGVCLVQFKRVCPGIPDRFPVVSDTDDAYRPRVWYDDTEVIWTNPLEDLDPGCVDHVLRGCYNNGTCVAPNVCSCTEGWTGPDCSIPTCADPCQNGGNCTLPNTCTCEKGWTGPTCTIPLCAQDCNNGGNCTAPDQCTCKTRPSAFRDNRQGTGLPVFKKPNGDPMDTGYTGYDCNTPICVQAQEFLLNTRDGSIPLGGHGKDGKLECYAERCPMFDQEVVRNDGFSFQSGCGRAGNPQRYPESGLSDSTKIANLLAYRDVENVNRTDPTFLCGVTTWTQGDYLQGRRQRVNYQHQGTEWIENPQPGEGIFRCHNSGTCIAPDTCTCTDGWSGFDCRTPLCRHRTVSGQVNGCLHGGICSGKDSCTCIRGESLLHTAFPDAPRGTTGWMGTDCSIPICVQGLYDAQCEAEGGEGCYRCPNGGNCTAPDYCTCAEGWTGYDCTTPICELEADDQIREELHTYDERKIREFELDPCGIDGGRWGKESVDNVLQGTGNCTLPGLCTCLCKVWYDEEDCNEKGENCDAPWSDLLGRSLGAGYTYGTRSCVDGYQGKTDVNGNYLSCHLRIKVPTLMERYTVAISATSLTVSIVLGVAYYIISRKMRERALRLKRAKRRRSRENLEKEEAQASQPSQQLPQPTKQETTRKSFFQRR